MKIFLLILFAADSIVNVAACALGKQKLRRASKVLLMPLLAAVYCMYARQFSPLVLTAVLLGWAGDIFLIFKADRRLLVVGMLAFGLGHIFYDISICVLLGVRPPLWAAIAVPAGFIVGVIFFFRFLSRTMDKRMRAPTIMYMLLLCSLPALALLALFGGAPGAWLLCLGGTFFLCSDGTLSVETFVLEDSPRLDFVVMSTYIAAQALLVAGFCA